MNLFVEPLYAWTLLFALPALCGFFFWSWRVKQKLIRQFVQTRLLAGLTVGVSLGRQKFRLALLAAAFAGILLALARPHWGFAWEESKQQGLDIVVAIDTSRSMLAQDVAPNRITKAKLAAFDLMQLAKNDRIGIVAFAGTAFLQSPLTLDEEAFRQNLDTLDVGIIPQGGTAVSEAISSALGAFEKESDNHKVLVLFTDGEDDDMDTSGALAAADEAAKAGMRIFTIGVGTPEGELLRVTDEHGTESFIKDDDGNVVKSRLNETLLKKIATTTQGFYLPLLGANPMETLYARGLAPLPKSDSTRLTQVFRERYHLPLGFAILCLIFELLLPDRARSRRKSRAASPAPALQKAAAVLFILLLPVTAFSSPAKAFKDYQAGQYDAALDEYNRLADEKTNDYRLHYNAGTAAYKAKQLDTAQRQFQAALNSTEITPDVETQERAYYNLGNTLYHIGEPLEEPDKKKEQWEKAVENFDHALHLNTNDIDAKNNLAYVKMKLEELKKQQQKQDDQKPDDKEPSDAAKAAKARADEAVKQRQYKQALDIMDASRKQDPTTEYYADYIKRLEDINGVAHTNSR